MHCRFDLEPSDVLGNVAYARAHNCENQMQLLDEARQLMIDSRFSVLIVDSATALYRSEYRGRGELAERQNHMSAFLRGLQRIAGEIPQAVCPAWPASASCQESTEAQHAYLASPT